VIAACLKWVDRRPEVDPLDGGVTTHARTAGLSPADAAALEWALRAGEEWDRPVTAVVAGPAGADAVLRDALGCGAASVVRIDLDAATPSATVAAALAAVLREVEATTVWCGDHSLDRGSGSVPAFLAAELGAAQALGLVDVELGPPGQVTALRRLDGGRRERLAVAGAGVLSVEGSTARLRRAALRGVLAAHDAEPDVRAGPAVRSTGGAAVSSLRPYRPRPRTVAAPAGTTALARIAELTAAGTAKVHREVLALDPAEAAERILAALAAWGYDLPPP
jgi:electron transfer flavoprotein beta subunit